MQFNSKTKKLPSYNPILRSSYLKITFKKKCIARHAKHARLRRRAGRFLLINELGLGLIG